MKNFILFKKTFSDNFKQKCSQKASKNPLMNFMFIQTRNDYLL